MIELKDNGDIDISKLSQDELESLVDIKLDIAKIECEKACKGCDNGND